MAWGRLQSGVSRRCWSPTAGSSDNHAVAPGGDCSAGPTGGQRPTSPCAAGRCGAARPCPSPEAYEDGARGRCRAQRGTSLATRTRGGRTESGRPTGSPRGGGAGLGASGGGVPAPARALQSSGVSEQQSGLQSAVSQSPPSLRGSLHGSHGTGGPGRQRLCCQGAQTGPAAVCAGKSPVEL